MRLASLLLLSLPLAAHAAPDLAPQFEPRGGGEAELFELPLPDAPDGQCIAFAPSPGMAVLVARAVLEELADLPDDPAAVAHRQTRAADARALLKSARPGAGGGCDVGDSREGGGLLPTLLDAGLAAVRVDGAPVAQLAVRVEGGPGMGSATYRVPDGRELITYVWLTLHGSPAAPARARNELF